MDFRKFKGAIFDFDGTLADTMGLWSDIDDMFLSKRGIEVPEDYAQSISAMNFEQAAEYTINLFGLNMTVDEVIAEWYDIAVYEHTHNVFFKKGAAEFVRRLRGMGMKIAIASASDMKLIIPALENNGASQLFDVFAVSNEVERGKGFPDIYDLARDRLGLKTEECVVFEDIVPAIEGAKMGGYTTVAVFDERSADDRERLTELSDLYIESFEELI